MEEAKFFDMITDDALDIAAVSDAVLSKIIKQAEEDITSDTTPLLAAEIEAIIPAWYKFLEETTTAKREQDQRIKDLKLRGDRKTQYKNRDKDHARRVGEIYEQYTTTLRQITNTREPNFFKSSKGVVIANAFHVADYSVGSIEDILYRSALAANLAVGGYFSRLEHKEANFKVGNITLPDSIDAMRMATAVIQNIKHCIVGGREYMEIFHHILPRVTLHENYYWSLARNNPYIPDKINVVDELAVMILKNLCAGEAIYIEQKYNKPALAINRKYLPDSARKLLHMEHSHSYTGSDLDDEAT